MTTSYRWLTPALRRLVAVGAGVAMTWAMAAGLGMGPAAAQPASKDSGPADIDPALVDAASQARAAGDDAMRVLMVADRQPAMAGTAGTGRDAVAELKAVAAETESQVAEQLERLTQEVGDVRIVETFWIQNMLLVEIPRSVQSLESLSTVEGIDRLIPNFEMTLLEPEREGAEGAIVDDRTWGIDKIEAHRVHDELSIDGTGVRVATLDTGVDITHPDLQGAMVTDDPSDPQYPGGWMEFDEDGGLVASEPHDSAYHGTHVAGTIHGGDASGVQIGVAPGAEMMHGLVVPGGSGSFTQVAAGMQWAVDPTDANGNPVGEPADVVNMSLGAGAYVQEMIAPTQAIRAAGAFPAFAIGNKNIFGSCGVGSSSPGNVYEAVGIGATDENDNVADFSCGNEVASDDWPDAPSEWPDTYIKPDISAPGVNTYSAEPGGDYQRLSGTSMATPHTAGTVALMRQAAPELGVDALLQQLEDTSFFDDRHGADRPNTRYGHGRINAYEATLPISVESGIQGTVTSDDGDPIEGATVTVEGGPTVTTDADGTYTARLHPGSYDLEADAFGHEAQTAEGVEVAEDQFTTQDFELTSVPVGSVAGQVTFANSGEGIPGVEVELAGTGLNATTDTAGEYVIDEVPAGDYTVAAVPEIFPAPPGQDVTVEPNTTTTADFVLEAPAGGISMVTSDPGGQFADYFAEKGIDADIYDTDELAQAANGYRTVIWGYNSSAPGKAAFEDFLDDTDRARAGVIFLDQAFGTWNGLKTLSEYTGQPETVETSTSGSGQASVYEVSQSHPVVEGYEPGDEIVHDEESTSAWIAWFDGYEGAGREVVAGMSRSGTDEVYGGGIGVQERATNRHVLLASHSSSSTRGPEEWTAESEQVFWNAIDWASPEADPNDPFFVASDLEVEPDTILGGETVDVSVDVTNVGASEGDHAVVLEVGDDREATTSVTLGAGETTEIDWEVTRDAVGTYEVSVEHLTDSFRVRPPLVDLTVNTLDGAGHEPAPMADAQVEIVDDGERLAVGTTDEDGALEFESTGSDEEYTLVVRRHATDQDEEAYLLAREVRIDEDTSIEMNPRTVAQAGMGTADYVWDMSALVDVSADSVDAEHEAWTYLRHGLTAPFGYAYQPGPVVMTIADADGVEAVNVHSIEDVNESGRDWWYVSELVDGLDWRDPVGYDYRFGGPAEANLDASFTEGTEFEAEWSVTDAHGIPYQVVLETGLQPFAEMPDALELEQVADTVRDKASDEAEVLLRLRAPDGEAVHAGGVAWDQRSLTRDLADLVDEVESGAYTLELEAETGPYSGTVTDDAELVSSAPSRSLADDVVERGGEFDVEVTFSPTTTDAVSVSESIASAGGQMGTQAIGNGWPVTDWQASVPAEYDDAGTWSFDATGLTPGEQVTLSYSVASPFNIAAPSEWVISGQLHQDGASTPITGDTELRVVEQSGDDGVGAGSGNNGRGPGAGDNRGVGPGAGDNRGVGPGGNNGHGPGNGR